MSDRLGPVSYRAGEEHVFLGKEIMESRDFSEGTARIIDEEIQRILNQAEAKSLELLAANRDKLDKLASALIVQEELDKDAVDRLFRGIPDPPPPIEPPVQEIPPVTVEQTLARAAARSWRSAERKPMKSGWHQAKQAIRIMIRDFSRGSLNLLLFTTVLVIPTFGFCILGGWLPLPIVGDSVTFTAWDGSCWLDGYGMFIMVCGSGIGLAARLILGSALFDQ